MAIFSSIVAWVAAYVFDATASVLITDLAIIATYAALISATSLLIKRLVGAPGSSGGLGGGRIQLPPATDNKLPAVYGSAFIGGPIIDAKISTDQQTMWYVIALSEVLDTSSATNTFGNVYYDGKLVAFNNSVPGGITSLETNTNPATYDTKPAGKLFIYKFTNGSSSGVNTGGQTAWEILSDSQIPSSARWTSADTMTNCTFIIVKIIFNPDAGLVGLGSITAQLTNTVDKPGDAIYDYLINTRYGCAVPSSRIDSASIAALNTYSDELITYVPVGGGSATQPRYRVNGPVDTSNNCLQNLQFLADTCDSWLQYTELTGLWSVVINKPFPNSPVITGLYQVNDSNLISGIDISPVDLNNTYNIVEVAYPDRNVKDQIDYKTINLSDYHPEIMSPNEPQNKLNLTLPLVNQAVQAQYLGLRRMLQSREDLAITLKCDYSAIILEAGDVIRITFDVYGWTNKLFRISSVSEEKARDGTLSALINAFEYNGTIYDDNSIQDYVPAFNTGLTNPGIISIPDTPVLTLGPIANNIISTFIVNAVVPTEGIVTYMDFNYGTDSNVANHKLYRTLQPGTGFPFVPGEAISTDISTINPGTYYWSITARNYFAGRHSDASIAFPWDGPLVVQYDSGNNIGGITTGAIHINAATETFYYTDSNSEYNYYWNVIDQQFDLTTNSDPNLYLIQSNTQPTANLSPGYTTWYDIANTTFHFYDATSNWKVASGNTLPVSSLYEGDLFFKTNSNEFYYYTTSISPNGWYLCGVDYTRDIGNTIDGSALGVGPFSIGNALAYGAHLDFVPESDAVCIATIMCTAYLDPVVTSPPTSQSAFLYGILWDQTTQTLVSSAPHSGTSRNFYNIQSTTPQAFTTQWTSNVVAGHNYRLRLAGQVSNRYWRLAVTDIQLQIEVIKR